MKIIFVVLLMFVSLQEEPASRWVALEYWEFDKSVDTVTKTSVDSVFIDVYENSVVINTHPKKLYTLLEIVDRERFNATWVGVDENGSALLIKLGELESDSLHTYIAVSYPTKNWMYIMTKK